MKFLKYHHKWAWGTTPNEFTCLGEEVDDILIEDVCESLVDANSYSDKYRGISYDVLEVSDLSKDEKAILIKEYTDKIKRYKSSIKHFIKIKELLK